MGWNGAPVSGAILPCMLSGVTSFDFTTTADRLYVSPFFVGKVVSVDALVFQNAGTADTGDDIRLGLYDTTTDGLPGALLGETGEIALDNTEDVRIGAMGGSVTLLPNNAYWLALVTNGNPVILFVDYAQTTSHFDAFQTQNGIPAWNAGLPVASLAPSFYKAHTYGALPDPFGTPTAGSGFPILGAQVA